MDNQKEEAIDYLLNHHPNFLGSLQELVAIPSISTDPEYKEAVRQAAAWVAGRLLQLGAINVSIHETARSPILYGEILSTRPHAPTVLIYGHYDVQPAFRPDLWESAPFTPDVRGEHIYGRGVSDMKGQLVACLAAIEAIVQTGCIPVNYKFLIEGEEEIGSPSLESFISDHTGLLQADLALNLDAGMLARNLPTITYGLRGGCMYELRLYGPGQDLHSGLFGGVVDNPAQVLCRIIAAIQDEHGHITLPGFYDRVLPIDAQEQDELARLPIDEAYFLHHTGVPELGGEPGYSPFERTTLRPSLDVNSLFTGYTGSGFMTIIPATATAKISMRLVPNQEPKEIYQQLRQVIEDHIPRAMRYDLIEHVSFHPVIIDRHSPPARALQKALETAWGNQAVFTRVGFSVPVVVLFQKHLQIDTLNTGFAILSEARVHSPNENLHLPTWYRGMQALVHFFYNITDAV